MTFQIGAEAPDFEARRRRGASASTSEPAAGVVGVDLADQERPVAQTLNGLPDDLLGAALGVHLGRVDERQAELDAEPKGGDLSRALPGALAHGPGALSECGNRFSGRQQDGSGHGIRSCVAHAVSRTSGAGFLYSRKPPSGAAHSPGCVIKPTISYPASWA